MFCKKCGSASPDDGFLCKVCGSMVSEDQIKEQKKLMQEKGFQKRMSIREKYGQKNNTIFNEKKDNSALMGAILLIVIVFLAIISVVIFLINR